MTAMKNLLRAVTLVLFKPVSVVTVPFATTMVALWVSQQGQQTTDSLRIVLGTLIAIETAIMALVLGVVTLLASEMAGYTTELDECKARWLQAIVECEEWEALFDSRFYPPASVDPFAGIANLSRKERALLLRRLTGVRRAILNGRVMPDCASASLARDSVAFFRISCAFFFAEEVICVGHPLSRTLWDIELQRGIVRRVNRVSNHRLAMRRGIPTLVGVLLTSSIAALGGMFPIESRDWTRLLATIAIIPLPVVFGFIGFYVDEMRRPVAW